MPATGKSTIGRHVARQLGLAFIDLDDCIIADQGKPITEIFQTKGENYFREIERRLLIEHINMQGGFVMATGGGAPCFFDNMQLMNQNGITIFLNVSMDELFQKLVRKGTTKRPLLKNFTKNDLYNELIDKFKDRKKYYSKSKITVDQNFNGINERVNQVIFAIKMLEKQSEG